MKQQSAVVDNIFKSFGVDLQKGGEGSRGGHVTGHTAEGHPIYESHFIDSTKVPFVYEKPARIIVKRSDLGLHGVRPVVLKSNNDNGKVVERHRYSFVGPKGTVIPFTETSQIMQGGRLTARAMTSAGKFPARGKDGTYDAHWQLHVLEE